MFHLGIKEYSYSHTFVQKHYTFYNDVNRQLILNIIFFITIIFAIVHFPNVSANNDLVYQPVHSEIDRFKMIQEQIQHQQEQEQQQQQQQQKQQDHIASESIMDESVMARHAFLGHLLSHLTGRPSIHQGPPMHMEQESQIIPQQQIQPQLPFPNHQQMMAHYPPMPISHQQQQQQQQQLQVNPEPQGTTSLDFHPLFNKNLGGKWAIETESANIHNNVKDTFQNKGDGALGMYGWILFNK